MSKIIADSGYLACWGRMIVDPKFLACWGRMKVKVNVGMVKVIVGQGHVKDDP